MIRFSDSRWAEVRKHAAQWWAGRLDRPLVQLRLWGADPGRPEPRLKRVTLQTPYDLSIPAEAIVDKWDFDLASHEYLGDSFPCVWPNLGPGVLATALGAEATAHEQTTWFHPAAELEIDRLRLRYDPDSAWMRRVKDLGRAAVDRWHGAVQVAMTDLGGTMDVLSTFLPGESLLLALYDHPAEVKRLTREIHDAWWAAFRDLDASMRDANPGYTAWCPIFSEPPYYMLQCDFCYMIGPGMFDEFVKPELAASCAKLVHGFYHLDGPGQLAHLDSLLAIPQLKGVQWVPGSGRSAQAEWPEVYRKIRAAGKRIQIYDDAQLTQLTRIAEHLGDARGIVAIGTGRIEDKEKAETALAKFGVE